MRIKSPLSNLSEIINQIKESAGRYRNTLQRNEAATRAVLIDPILQALGWDTANIYMVEVEKTLDQSRVDYALHDHDANVSIIIEAKPLGTNLNDNNITMSMVKYAYNFGTERIFLSDGLTWLSVTIKEPRNIEVKSVDFTKDTAVDCASFLVERLDAARFWPEEKSIDELTNRIAQLELSLAVLQKQLPEQKDRSLHEKSEPTILIAPKVDEVRKRPVPVSGLSTLPQRGIWTSLRALHDVTGTAPSMLRLPNGNEIRVRSWSEVLKECCKFALRINPIISVPFPDYAGRRVNLIDIIRPKSNLSFFEDEYRGRTVFIYTNYPANGIVSNALHILKQVPSSAGQIEPAVII